MEFKMPYLTTHPGIIIAASVLVAAGVAIYNDPQVQEWLETSRRKIATALSSLSEELNGASSQSPHHGQTREQQLHALSQATKKHNEWMENEKYREILTKKRDPTQPGRSFDDFLVRTPDQGEGEGWVRGVADQSSVRHRHISVRGQGPEMTESESTTSGAAVLTAEEAGNLLLRDGYPYFRTDNRSPPPQQYQPQPREESAKTISNPTTPLALSPATLAADDPEMDEHLICLTPTTSSSNASLISLPSVSSDHARCPSPLHTPVQTSLDASLHSWIFGSTDSSASSEDPSHTRHHAMTASILPSPVQAAHVDDTESVISDADFMSDAGPGLTPTDGRSQINTPDSWSEVGSEVSDEDYHVSN